MVSRRRRRTARIKEEIIFYLEVMMIGEWVENTQIIQHLSYSARGKQSYNALTSYALGQMISHIPQIEKRVVNFDGHGKKTQYRYIMEEE